MKRRSDMHALTARYGECGQALEIIEAEFSRQPGTSVDDPRTAENAENIPASRAEHIHFARVHLREARARRLSHPRMWFSLMEWARNARLRAAACRPTQGDLFGASGGGNA